MNLRIMFVDNDQQLLNTYKKYFNLHGFITDCVATKDEAVQLLVKKKYAAVVTELRLGDLPDNRDGIAVASEAHLFSPTTKVFFLTARRPEEFQREAVLAGGSMCISKRKPLAEIKEMIELAIHPARFNGHISENAFYRALLLHSMSA